MRNRNTKKIFITLALIFMTTINANAQLGTRTQNQIKAKFLTAQEMYDEKDYSGSLEKINEIEELTNGQLLAAAQNLKVKCLVGQGKYIKAKDELYTLEGLNLSSDILKDISAYGSQIKKNVEKEEKIQFKEKIKSDLGSDLIDYLPDFEEGTFFGSKVDGKYGYVDLKLEIVIPFDYDDGTFKVFAKQDLINVNLNGKWGYINRSNEIVVQFKYEELQSMYMLEIAGAKLNGKWGFIDKDDNIIINFKYDTGWSTNKGFMIVSKNKKYGLIDSSDKILVPFSYDLLFTIYNSNLISAYKDGKRGIIDTKGNIVEPFK